MELQRSTLTSLEAQPMLGQHIVTTGLINYVISDIVLTFVIIVCITNPNVRTRYMRCLAKVR
jgi:hypothetical protein